MGECTLHSCYHKLCWCLYDFNSSSSAKINENAGMEDDLDENITFDNFDDDDEDDIDDI